MFDIDNELCLLEKYKLLPTEMFAVKTILLAQRENNNEPLKRFKSLLDGKFQILLERLQNKGIILKSCNISKQGEVFDPLDIVFNKNFLNQVYRSSFEMGMELFETYPLFITIQGITFNARRVSKKFVDLEQALAKYGKVIKYNNELHQQIIANIKAGIEKGYNFTTLDDFICDRGWLALDAYLKGEGININIDAMRMI